MSDDIVFHGLLDEETFTAALSHARAPRRLLGCGMLFVLLIGADMLVLVILGRSPRPWFPVFILAALFTAFLWFVTRHGARKQFATSKLLHGTMRGIIREDGFELHSDYTTLNLPWSLVDHFEMRPDVLLLFTAPNIAQILPRAFFASDAEWEAVRARVTAHVPPQPAIRPRGIGVGPTLILWIIIVVGILLLYVLFGRGPH
jgi:hypothetical protein